MESEGERWIEKKGSGGLGKARESEGEPRIARESEGGKETKHERNVGLHVFMLDSRPVLIGTRAPWVLGPDSKTHLESRCCATLICNL